MLIIKRDGSKVKYDKKRIFNAISGANNDVYDEKMNEEEIENITKLVEKEIFKYDEISVEKIQDIVERKLMEHGFFSVSKEYIMYRYKHMIRRINSENLMDKYKDILFTDAKDLDSKRENANINTDAPMGIMLKLGTDGAKHFLSEIIPKEFYEAHKSGRLHYHDADFSLITFNCCQIDLLKLFKGGFSTGIGYLREPNSIRSYAALACIAIQSTQSDMFGGQSINAFDYAMAEGIRKSFKKSLKKYINIYNYYFNKNIDIENLPDIKYLQELSGELYESYINKLIEIGIDKVEAEKNYNLACKEVEEETKQAMEAMIHNFCTLRSRSGGQVPFSSINFGTDTTPEGRLAIYETLRAIDSGLGDHSTSLFPISIFRILKGVNYEAGEPNYDLFKYACKVSARRMYPNFLNCSASYNLKYYKPGNYNTLAATMGCAHGTELVIYKYNEICYAENFEMMWNRINAEIKTHNHSEYKECDKLFIWDASNDRFVRVLKVIHNKFISNWTELTFNGRSVIVTDDHPIYTVDGRKLVKDLTTDDFVESYFKMPKMSGIFTTNTSLAYSFGVFTVCRTIDNSIMMNRNDKVKNKALKYFEFITNNRIMEISIELRESGLEKTEIRFLRENGFHDYINLIWGEYSNHHIPVEILSMDNETRKHFLGGIIDGNSKVDHKFNFSVSWINKTLALQFIALIQSLGIPGKIEKENSSYIVHFKCPEFMRKYIITKEKRDMCRNIENIHYTRKLKVKEIKPLNIIADSYDVETETDKFTLSFINSGNCRTRVISNVNGPEETGGRGNFAFVTLNLPYYALMANGDINKFYEIYDKHIQIAHDYLLWRLQIIADKKVYNFPMIMGEHVWMGSDKLHKNDSIREVLKHATYSIGVCGLSECLIALTGKHHGESDESQKLGLEIIDYLGNKLKEYTEKEKMNWSAFASPSESTAGSMLKACRKQFGIIPRITDKMYLTNSSHIDVNYKISAIDKIRKEAPYHEKFTAGQIMYIEYDGDPLDNLQAFEKLIKTMCEYDASYLAINHPLDRDPVCGYNGIIKNKCPICGRSEHSSWRKLQIKE